MTELSRKMTQVDPNSREANDENFKSGASFDLADGRKQTRFFAEAFHRHVKIPIRGEFSVLDVGCALGDALPVWRLYYPRARLFGCDFSSIAILRARDDYGKIAEFFCASFEEIVGQYDVIYCSNVLEHFRDPAEIARTLLQHCSILYIMVPYRELLNGRPLAPGNDYYHKTTFDLSSFSGFQLAGDCSVSAKIIRAPGAWSPSLLGELRWLVRRHILGRAGLPARQVVFTVARKN
jgi:SAM-dependent methyltransferase